MRQETKKIYNHLLEYQQRFGGYTGKDLDETARIFGLNKRTLKRNVEKWSKNDPLFSKLRYIGQRSIPITLDEITLLNQRLKENITCTKQVLVREINDNRIRRGDVPIRVPPRFVRKYTLRKLISPNLYSACTHHTE